MMKEVLEVNYLIGSLGNMGRQGLNHTRALGGMVLRSTEHM